MPFDGPRLKMAVAKDELLKLDSDLDKFVKNTDNYDVVRQLDSGAGEDVWTAKVRGPVDPSFAVRAGCIAHLLRSTLDNLVFELALLNTSVPHPKITFPIFLSHAEFFDRAANPALHKKGARKGKPIGMMTDLSPDHLTLIESYQPYNAGDRNNVLWLLHEINNADKHRTIPIVVARGIPMHFKHIYGGGNFAIGLKLPIGKWEELVDGAELFRAKAHPDTQPEFSIRVCFGNECPDIAKRPIVECLGRIGNEVNSLVEKFAKTI